MKRKQGNYLQLSRNLFNDDRFKGLSNNAKWLYVVLNELEHRFTGKKGNDYFFRSNEDLAQDTAMSLPVLKKAKKELKEAGVIQVWQGHWKDPPTGKLSEKHITAYRVLE